MNNPDAATPLAGRIALVTGASRGIGAATAIWCACYASKVAFEARLPAMRGRPRWFSINLF